MNFDALTIDERAAVTAALQREAELLRSVHSTVRESNPLRAYPIFDPVSPSQRLTESVYLDRALVKLGI